MTAIRHIVFDIGRVLIHYDPELAFHDLIPDARERAWFLSEVCSPAWNIEQDRGRSWSDAEAELIALHPERASHIRSFRKSWRKMVPHAHEETVNLLKEMIQAGRDVTLLTNFATDTFEEALEMFPFLSLPRGVTVSGRVGLLKPDVAIYGHHAEAFSLDPAATLFIDDSAANVAGAREAGWHAIRYLDHAGLLEELARYEIV